MCETWVGEPPTGLGGGGGSICVLWVGEPPTGEAADGTGDDGGRGGTSLAVRDPRSLASSSKRARTLSPSLPWSCIRGESKCVYDVVVVVVVMVDECGVNWGRCWFRVSPLLNPMRIGVPPHDASAATSSWCTAAIAPRSSIISHDTSFAPPSLASRAPPLRQMAAPPPTASHGGCKARALGTLRRTATRGRRWDQYEAPRRGRRKRTGVERQPCRHRSHRWTR